MKRNQHREFSLIEMVKHPDSRVLVAVAIWSFVRFFSVVALPAYVLNSDLPSPDPLFWTMLVMSVYGTWSFFMHAQKRTEELILKSADSYHENLMSDEELTPQEREALDKKAVAISDQLYEYIVGAGALIMIVIVVVIVPGLLRYLVS